MKSKHFAMISIYLFVVISGSHPVRALAYKDNEISDPHTNFSGNLPEIPFGVRKSVRDLVDSFSATDVQKAVSILYSEPEKELLLWITRTNSLQSLQSCLLDGSTPIHFPVGVQYYVNGQLNPKNINAECSYEWLLWAEPQIKVLFKGSLAEAQKKAAELSMHKDEASTNQRKVKILKQAGWGLLAVVILGSLAHNHLKNKEIVFTGPTISF